MKIIILFIFHILKTYAANFELHNQLTPVHGLFVKPSEDGVTGDLYVAASEDTDVNSQWLTEHPVNILPKTTQTQAASTPIKFTKSFTTSTSPNEETVTTQKRAVIKSPTLKYAYALSVPGAIEGRPFNPYPFGFYAPNTPKSEETPNCQTEGKTTIKGLSAYPYPYYCPQMMSALTAAMDSVNEKENEANSHQPVPHHWPGTYAYPYQYIMLDPTAWTHSQSSTTEKENNDDDKK